jgi:hypothetical protein
VAFRTKVGGRGRRWLAGRGLALLAAPNLTHTLTHTTSLTHTNLTVVSILSMRLLAPLVFTYSMSGSVHEPSRTTHALRHSHTSFSSCCYHSTARTCTQALSVRAATRAHSTHLHSWSTALTCAAFLHSTALRSSHCNGTCIPAFTAHAPAQCSCTARTCTHQLSCTSLFTCYWHPTALTCAHAHHS